MKKLNRLNFVFICLNFRFVLINSEYYSSISAMIKLYNLEMDMLTGMGKYINKQENKLNYLKEKLVDFEREHSEAVKNGAEYFENPINNYLLNKRLTLDWEKTKNLMEYDISEAFVDKWNQHEEKYKFPNDEELHGTVQALIRIQTTYKINTNKMVNGELNGVKYSTEMSADDCFHIGRMAFNQSELEFADSWLFEALQRHQKGIFGNIIKPVKKFSILELLSEVNLQLGNTKKALNYYKELLKYQPDNKKALKNKAILIKYNHKKNVCEPKAVFFGGMDFLRPELTDEFELYKMACRGELKKPTNILRELHCGYLTETHPFLILAPIKVEELSLNPLVVVYYDILNDEEIEEFQEFARRRLTRASVVNSKDGSSIISNVRTSQFAFWGDRNDPIIKILDQRMEDMTGLSMNASESLQVANYGIGGHYSIHSDSFEENRDDQYSYTTDLQENGNRLATLLFYMSDVEQGGATVFPYQNITIYPKKGSAAFWYSLHLMGEADLRSRHAACPTLVGSKWVLNKWIRVKGQIFHRPCDIYPDNIY